MARRLVGVAGELLVTLGALVLLFVVWQLWWTDVVANRQAAQVVERLREDFAGDTRGTAAGTDGVTPVDLPSGAFALLHVPRFGDGWVRPVLDGTDRDVLASGVGHYDGTAGPGEVGNFAVAGHRTTWGRPFHDIDRLGPGDRVLVETADHVYVYAVTAHEVVPPSDVDVVAAVPGEPGATPQRAVLTMTSCHPRYSAAERYVVHAELLDTLDPADLDPALTAATEG